MTLRSVRTSTREPMTQDQWLRYGIEHGFCSDIVCDTHDGMPSSGEEEDAEWEAGGDPCVSAVRIFQVED